MNQPLSQQQQAELRSATELYRPLARAAKRAEGNGKWLAIFGGLSLAWGVFTVDVVSMVIGAVVLTTGIVELRQGRRLSAAEPDAPIWLCRNELVLGATIALYAILKLTVWRETSDELQEQLGGAELRSMGMDIEGMYDSMNTLIYATVLAVTFLYQGGMARYFLKQREAVDTFREEVEPWAREVVQSVER